MADAIRLGIIGCGRVCWERHHPALGRLPEFRVAAVCDTDSERAGRIATLFGAVRALSDYRELAGQKDIDAVAVLTPPGAHAEVGIAVLEAGKHLFVEKPLALTMEGADRLVEAGRKSGRVAQVCFNLRRHRLIRDAKAILEAGTLGSVKAIRSVYTHDRTGANAPDWHRKIALGGGVCLNEGVHHFDLWRYLLGVEVERVEAFGIASEAYELETAVVSARLGGGVLASMVTSFLSGPNNELEVFGEKGRLLISLYRFDGLQFYSSRTYPGASADRLKRGVRAMAALPALLRDVRNGGGFQASFAASWKEFGNCVRTGQPACCTLEDGRKALEIALAAGASASSVQPATEAAGGSRDRQCR